MEWLPIEQALPYIRDQETDYLSDVRVILVFPDGKQSVGYWDEYYAEGGSGYDGSEAWVEPCSGELLSSHYGTPTHWMPLPPPPVAE